MSLRRPREIHVLHALTFKCTKVLMSREAISSGSPGSLSLITSCQWDAENASDISSRAKIAELVKRRVGGLPLRDQGISSVHASVHGPDCRHAEANPWPE